VLQSEPAEPGAAEAHEVPQISKPSTRRKKHSRRNIVDLAHDDTPWQPHSPIIGRSRPSNDSRRSTDGITAGRTERIPERSVQIMQSMKMEPQQERRAAAAAAAAAAVEDEIEMNPDETLQDDEFRNQAEALRRELGSNWLSALPDQRWHASHQVDLQRMQQIQQMQGIGTVPGLHRANTMVATSGRTLG